MFSICVKRNEYQNALPYLIPIPFYIPPFPFYFFYIYI
nr:MAG TPA: hypothetical protein [Caudoviricetes sp.]